MNTRAIRYPPKKFWPKDSNRIWLEKLYYKFKTEVIWNPLLYKADTSQKVCFSKALIRTFFQFLSIFFCTFYEKYCYVCTSSMALFKLIPFINSSSVICKDACLCNLWITLQCLMNIFSLPVSAIVFCDKGSNLWNT